MAEVRKVDEALSDDDGDHDDKEEENDDDDGSGDGGGDDDVEKFYLATSLGMSTASCSVGFKPNMHIA